LFSSSSLWIVEGGGEERAGALAVGPSLEATVRDPLGEIRRRYPQLAKDILGPFLDTLNVGRAACGGDLDKLLIVLVVAMRTAEDRRAAKLSPEDVLSGRLDEYPSLSTNVRSIADSTGIPKESVRRKVAALVEEGWIRREDNALSLDPQASRRLAGVREQLFHLALRYQHLVDALDGQDR
jgi:hypothetical protein